MDIQIVCRYGSKEETYNPTPEQVELIMMLLKDDLKVSIDMPLQINDIKYAVCAYLGISVSNLESKGRKTELVYGRQMFFWFAKNKTRRTLKDIGKSVSGRDHTTVIHGLRTLKNRFDTEENVRTDIFNVSELLKKFTSPASTAR